MNISHLVIKTVVNLNDSVVLVGSSLGRSTIVLSQAVGSEGKVFSFEPDIESYNIQKENLNKASIKNVILENKAVMDKAGKIKIYLPNEHLDNRMYIHTYQAKDSQEIAEVEAITIDEYFKDYKGEIDFMQFDVQGSEFHVLKGAIETIKRFPKLKLFTCFYNIGIEASGLSGRDFLNTLSKLGFSFKELDRNCKDIIPIKNFNDILFRYPLEGKKRGNLTNLYCERL